MLPTDLSPPSRHPDHRTLTVWTSCTHGSNQCCWECYQTALRAAEQRGAEAEREACATIAEGPAVDSLGRCSPYLLSHGRDIAAVIRGRVEW